MTNKTNPNPESPVTASGRKKIVSTAKGSLTMVAMAIMIITSILSLRGLPSEAKFGIQSIFYYIFAAIVFLVPFSLVCAELASTYTKAGGLYRWVSEAFGPRWGWTAMYLEWQTIVIWFPTVLMFGAASLAYIAWPESFDAALASNKFYTLIVAMVIYWAATFNSFRGQKMANKLSTSGGLFGTIICCIHSLLRFLRRPGVTRLKRRLRDLLKSMLKQCSKSWKRMRMPIRRLNSVQ